MYLTFKDILWFCYIYRFMIITYRNLQIIEKETISNRLSFQFSSKGIMLKLRLLTVASVNAFLSH